MRRHRETEAVRKKHAVFGACTNDGRRKTKTKTGSLPAYGRAACASVEGCSRDEQRANVVPRHEARMPQQARGTGCEPGELRRPPTDGRPAQRVAYHLLAMHFG